MNIIGISGKIGCGKTTLADLLGQELRWSLRVSFAELVKAEASEAFGFPLAWCYSALGKAMRVRISAEHPLWKKAIASKALYEALLLEGAPTVRELLQWWGTDYRRAQNPDYWLWAMERALSEAREAGAEHVLIDDVRFPNEAHMIQGRRGGLVVRLDPYPGWQPGPYAGHASETALDDYQDFDLRRRPLLGELPLLVDEVVRWVLPEATFTAEEFDELAGGDALFDEQRCRLCGCTEDHACEGGCSWVAEDLCSACLEKVFKMGLVAMPALVKAQGVLARYLPPDSGVPAQEVVTELLGILDAETVVQAANAWEEIEARKAGAA